MPRWLAIALVPVLAVLAALATASPAGATLRGPCDAELAGADMSPMLVGARADALEVDRNSLLSVTMEAERPITRFTVELEFAGVRWTVHDRTNSGTRWASEVPVEDYGVYGMGLWKVVTTSEGNGFTCEASALVEIVDDHELDPLATIVGIVGLGLSLTGLLGTLAIAGRIGRSRAAPFSGVLLGAILGVGVTVLLQQFSVIYPTVGVTGAVVALGAAFGLAFSMFGLPGGQSDARGEIR